MVRAIFALILASCLLIAADDYDGLFQQAAELSAHGNYREAIGKYQAALKIRPDAPEALNNLAVMYYEVGEYQEAWNTASRVLRGSKSFSSANLIAGLSAIRLGRPGEAIAPLENVLKNDSANRDALLGLASAHVALRQLPEAASIYERQTARAPRDSDAWYGLAICYERMAEEASKQLSEMPGGGAYSKRLLGEYFLAQGDAQLAREAFGESAAAAGGTGSERAAAQYEKARDLAEQSRGAFEHFVELAPDSWQAHLFRGDLNRQKRKFDNALAEYEAAARMQPLNPAPFLGLGTVYWELGNFDQAEKSLREALRLNPDSLQATFELANIAVRRRQDSAAIPLLQKYLAAQPDALAARADLGRAYLHLGRFEEAERELSKAVAADTNGDIHYQLATALRKLGRAQEAEEALKKSAEIRAAELKREQRLKSGK